MIMCLNVQYFLCINFCVDCVLFWMVPFYHTTKLLHVLCFVFLVFK